MANIPQFKSRKILIKSKRTGGQSTSGHSSKRGDIKNNLAAVYQDSSGKIPDLTKLETQQKPLWKTVLYTLIGVFLVLFAISITGFLAFNNNDGESFTNENITLMIEPPLTLVSGQETVYTINITNTEKVNLYNVELELFYPDNFEYLEAEPVATGDNRNIWKFNIIRTGETQKIELKGKLTASINSVQTFRGILNFKPSGFNAVYRQEAIVDVAVSSSILSLDVSGPEKTLANQDVEYTIKYTNTGDADLVDLQLFVEYPDGFIFDSAEPNPNSQDNTWNIAGLKADEQGEIVIHGDYSAIDSGGDYDLKTQLRINKDGDYYPQSEDTFTTTVIKDQLTLQLVVNGSAEDQPINFDDLLVFSLNYKNTGQENLENIEIRAQIDSQIIDWGSFRDDNGGTWQGNTITWTGRQIPKLLKLGADEAGDISWTVRVKDSAIINDSRVSKFSVESFVEAKADQNDSVSGESEVTSKKIINTINSDLSLMAGARYYDENNLPLGLGPIEPKVDETSSYNLKFTLANNLHDIENISLMVSLPKNVTWSNKENHTTGDVNYNETAGQAIWTISRLPKSARQAEMSFNVSITPTDDDFGRVLVLASDIKLFAKDSDTGADINKTFKAITTGFNDPIMGEVNGIVQ